MQGFSTAALLNGQEYSYSQDKFIFGCALSPPGSHCPVSTGTTRAWSQLVKHHLLILFLFSLCIIEATTDSNACHKIAVLTHFFVGSDPEGL